MQFEPLKYHQEHFHSHQTHSTDDSTHHGPATTPSFSLLLKLPTESLISVSSFLDPVSLLFLAQVNKRLNQHVKDDATWRRAFLYQFCGIRPEDDLDGKNSFLIRRSESTWRMELISKWTIRRRWERSRSAYIIHIPHHGHVSGLHMVSQAALLTSSLFYGVAAHTIPLTGASKGLIGTAGRTHGLGQGNPNVDFSPDVSACSMVSEGNTAKILWGFRSGGLALVSASPVTNSVTRASTTVLCSAIHQQHDQEVKDMTWGKDHSIFVTASADGTIKLWDAKSLQCRWTSPMKTSTFPTSMPFTKVATSVSYGVIVGGQANGEIVVWIVGEDGRETVEVRVPQCQDADTSEPREQKEVAFLHVDARSPVSCRVLAVYANDIFCHRIDIDFITRTFTRTSFGNGASGIITSLWPSFAIKREEKSFVMAGDAFGYIHIFPWDDVQSSEPVHPQHSIEAFTDGGAVTSLAWNKNVVAAGSAAHGIIRVFDALSLQSVRTISLNQSGARAPPEPINHLILDNDMVVAGMGSRVLAWKAGPVNSNISKHLARSQKQWKRAGAAKGQVHYDIKQELRESRTILAQEQAYAKRVYGRERDHHHALSGLGLNEVEAVDYVLQLSRDEEEARRASLAEDGVFDGFEGVDTFDLSQAQDVGYTAGVITRRPLTSYPPSAVSRSPPSESGRMSASMSQRGYNMTSRVREPTHAGFAEDHAPTGRPRTPSPPSNMAAFPSLSASPSSHGASVPSTPQGHANGLATSPQWSRILSRASSGDPFRGPSSPTSSRGTSAWSIPMRQRSGPVNPARSETSAQDVVASPSNRSSMPDDEEVDDDLRYALELSLAEARSRGENV